MSINRPTPINEEVVWDKTKTIKSRTDAKGVIDYVNQTFVDVCGYAKEELMGQPHNIIRHPDMPKVLFKVLWDNIQKGFNFNAVIKNLSKSGRYYWIITNFNIFKDSSGIPVYYMAFRTAVPDKVVQTVEPIYQKLLEIEQKEGVEASEAYLLETLADYGGSYNNYIRSLMVENGIDISY